MIRTRAIASILCVICFNGLIATNAFAQTGFNGKWATDRPGSASLSGPDKGSIQADFTIEGNKVAGTIRQGGARRRLLHHQ